MLKSKLLTAAAVALSLTLGTVASLAVAQEPDKQTGKPGTGMMGGQSGTMGSPGGMMGNGGTMPMMQMMGQMNRMMENCNRMMEGTVQNLPTTPEKKG